jgi:dihydrolipoamide dehydrogenase
MSDPGAEHAYDVIVIGMGPVGVTAAEGARAAGLSVAAVERELVGGECSYWACTPSKAMLRPVVAVADARRVAGAQEAVTGLVNPEAVFARRDGYVYDWRDDVPANYLKSIGAELIRGQGRLRGPRQVAVESPSGGDGAAHGSPCRGDQHRQPSSPSAAGRLGHGPALD